MESDAEEQEGEAEYELPEGAEEESQEQAPSERQSSLSEAEEPRSPAAGLAPASQESRQRRQASAGKQSQASLKSRASRASNQQMPPVDMFLSSQPHLSAVPEERDEEPPLEYRQESPSSQKSAHSEAYYQPASERASAQPEVSANATRAGLNCGPSGGAGGLAPQPMFKCPALIIIEGARPRGASSQLRLTFGLGGQVWLPRAGPHRGRFRDYRHGGRRRD